MQKEQIQKWVKQLTCSHEWRSLGNMRWFIIHEYGCPIQYVCDDLECVKCGKKFTESIRSPWRFA